TAPSPFARAAAYELALLLSLTGRHKEADEVSHQLGFLYKLAPSILDGTAHTRASSKGAKDIVATFDGALPADLLEPLQKAFAPSSPFWEEHGYPTQQFFSYNQSLLPTAKR
ncbi:unnamed protein product, partial [Polarella glacialis]